MSGTVRLAPMTAEMYHAYYREYQGDPDLCLRPEEWVPFTYDPDWVDRYIRRQAENNRLCFAVMHGEEMVGELILRDIEPHARATLSICMKNAACKDRGFGARAERLAIEYVFDALDIPVLYADALLANARSRHVLEKVGFEETGADETFAYYRILREKWKEKADLRSPLGKCR